MKSAIILIILLIPALADTGSGMMGSGMMVSSPQGTVAITDCNQLNDTQLKQIGEQLMEQMMGHEAHEAMEESMGAELSELMDLRMGSMYTGCGNNAGYGMMGGMMPMLQGMMGGGTSMMSAWGWPFNFGMMGFGGGWGMVLGILFWVAVIVLIYWALTRSGIFARGESALEILKKRYARGEISAKQFKRMKKELI